MIVQVRGTSGSGKTWVMRQLLGPLYPHTWYHVMLERRRKPWYSMVNGIYVLGQYYATCGGCDGIGSAREVFEVYNTILTTDPTAIILSEGLLLSEDFKWTLEAHRRGWEPRVAYLTTNVDKCVDQVKDRRKEAGRDKPFNEDNTRYRVKVIDRSKVKLEAKGVYCRFVTSDKATELITNWIEECRPNKIGLVE